MNQLTPLRQRRSLLASILGLAGGGLLLSGCDRVQSLLAKPAFKSVDITGAEYAKVLQLPDPDGRVRSLAEFKGKVVVVFFGYVQCPDVCPTTMAELALIKKELGPQGDRVQGVFVTVDPERDTPELLKAYIDNFGAGFVALRGSNEETKAVAQHFKVFYSRVRGATPQTYTIDHTAGSYIYDPLGQLRLFSRYGTKTEDLVHDLKLLLKAA